MDTIGFDIGIPVEYASQIIGILGTVLGTVLGWLLHLLSNSIEKIYIFSDDYNEQKSNSNEYAYICKVFLYNASPKQQCIRNVRFSFAKYRWKVLFESTSSEGECSFTSVKSKNKNKSGMISIDSYAQKECYFSDIVAGENYKKLSEVRKIYLTYENKKNRTKRKLVKRDFDITRVKACKSESFL